MKLIIENDTKLSTIEVLDILKEVYLNEYIYKNNVIRYQYKGNIYTIAKYYNDKSIRYNILE